VIGSRKEAMMNGFRVRWLAFVLLPMLFVSARADDPEEKVVERLIKQLGDDDFEKREAATKRLVELGEPALFALRAAVNSKDVEVRRRVAELIPILEKQLTDDLIRFPDFTGDVWCIVFSGYGTRLVSNNDEITLRLWDLKTGKTVCSFKGHTERVVCAALSPDGKQLASCGQDRTVRLWKLETGKELRRFDGHAKPVSTVCFAGPKRLLSGGRGELKVWNLENGKEERDLAPNEVRMHCLTASRDGKWVASGGEDGILRLWDLDTGKELRRFVGHDDAIYTVSFSPDGKRLLSGGDNTIRVWDVKTGQELRKFEGHTSAVCCIALSADGRRLLSGSADKTVRVWDVTTGTSLRCYQHTNTVIGVAFFPDGKRFVSGSYDSTVRIWSVPRRLSKEVP
jgi:WD40 repeat protein